MGLFIDVLGCIGGQNADGITIVDQNHKCDKWKERTEYGAFILTNNDSK
jgi:hypothetical protein